MKTITKVWFFVALISFIACTEKKENAQASDLELEARIVEKIDSIGKSYLDKGGVMGITIAIAKEGKMLYNKGFGYIDSLKTQPVSNDNYFLMASISKLVGATVIMKLAEEGKLSLDSSIYHLLPDYPDAGQAKKIKLYHLLTHTSGLKDYAQVIDSVYMETGKEPTKTDYYAFFKSHDLDFEPGTNYNYSNSGFLLMAMIVESVTDSSFASEIDRVINKPTHLEIKLIAERADDPRTTGIFNWSDNTLEYQPHWRWITGDGGLTSTSEDLALFPFFWSNGTIISRESFASMCTPVILSDGVKTGYGIGVRTGKFEDEYCVGHTGGNKSTWALMKYYPELKTSVVVMVNTDNSPADAQVIEGFVSLAVLGKKLPDLTAQELIDYDPKPFLGDYQTVDNFYYGSTGLSIVKYKDDPRLYRKPTGTEYKGQKLYYLGGHSFGYDNFPMDRVIFEPDSTGKIVAFNTYWNGLRKGGFYRKK